jgi:hypothetical protein
MHSYTLIYTHMQYAGADASSTAIRPGSEMQDAQGYVATMVLTALTGLRNPRYSPTFNAILF